MKVAILTLSISKTDGWGRYSVELIKAMDNHLDLKVITASDQSELEGIETHCILPNKLDMNLNEVKECSSKIIEHIENCDLIHCLTEPYIPLITQANNELNKPFIVSCHGSYAVAPLDTFYSGLLLKYSYLKCNRVICSSKFTEKEILKRIGLNNTSVILLGVDNAKFQDLTLNEDKPNTPKKILSVGAVKPRKGYENSIKAFSKYKEYNNDAMYYIVGNINNKEYYNVLLKEIDELNIVDSVKFLGTVSDDELIKLYKTSDVFMLTSRNMNNNFEGFGLVYLEANAFGIPAIGTYGCGAEDAIVDGYNGVLVPQEDHIKTAEAIKYLSDNPMICKEMGENGIKRAKELSWDNVVDNVMDVYNETLTS
jgi:glycosyltransferase involved in cell wall biosynthesis